MSDLAGFLQANGIASPLERIKDYDNIFAITSNGDAAVPTWHKLRAFVDVIGYWPVILGVRHEALMTLADANVMDPAPVQETLDYAKKVDVAGWIRQKRELDPDIYTNVDEGPWTPHAVARQTQFSLPFEVLSKRPYPMVLIALVPTRLSSEVPAFLRFGNWNDCPEAAVHVAFANHWHKRYEAEIVCLGRDTLEMTVARPPKTRNDALIIAHEQYMYCSDIVDQGVGSISNLAAALLDGKIWYFWWD